MVGASIKEFLKKIMGSSSASFFKEVFSILIAFGVEAVDWMMTLIPWMHALLRILKSGLADGVDSLMRYSEI